MKNISMVDLLPDVYSWKPNSLCNPSNLSKRKTPSDPESPNPNWGIKFPVVINDMYIAGTMKAKISTQYCATWVYVIPFIPPRTA